MDKGSASLSWLGPVLAADGLQRHEYKVEGLTSSARSASSGTVSGNSNSSSSQIGWFVLCFTLVRHLFVSAGTPYTATCTRMSSVQRFSCLDRFVTSSFCTLSSSLTDGRPRVLASDTHSPKTLCCRILRGARTIGFRKRGSGNQQSREPFLRRHRQAQIN